MYSKDIKLFKKANVFEIFPVSSFECKLFTILLVTNQTPYFLEIEKSNQLMLR